MSGYFDALMRSSGMPIANRTPVTAPLERTGLEIVDDRPAVPQERHLAASPQESAPRRLPEPAAATPAARTTETVDEPAHEAHRGALAHPPAAGDQTVDSPSRSEAQSAQSLQPDLGQTLVRAAMRWVATPTPQPTDGGPLVAGREPSPPTVRDTATTTSLMKERADEQATPPGTPSTTNVTPDVQPRESVAATALPIRSTLLPAPPQPVASAPRDEVVEVSIGAIHVRVDAPSPQTVARPATAPPNTNIRRAGSTASGSRWSRRAVRRI